MRVLVAGGASYIGSVVAQQLIAAGHTITNYDNLSKGHQQHPNGYGGVDEH